MEYILMLNPKKWGANPDNRPASESCLSPIVHEALKSLLKKSLLNDSVSCALSSLYQLKKGIGFFGFVISSDVLDKVRNALGAHYSFEEITRIVRDIPLDLQDLGAFLCNEIQAHEPNPERRARASTLALNVVETNHLESDTWTQELSLFLMQQEEDFQKMCGALGLPSGLPGFFKKVAVLAEDLDRPVSGCQPPAGSYTDPEGRTIVPGRRS